MEENINKTALFIVVLLFINFWVWLHILSFNRLDNPEIHFLDVGQGDAQLMVLPKEGGGTVKILNDAGQGTQVLGELSASLGPYDNRYIDFLIMSHAHLDHYGGYIDVLSHYDVGAFVYNGHDVFVDSFIALMDFLEEKDIPIIVLGERDRIRYLRNTLDIVSPDEDLIEVGDLDEASLVFVLDTGKRRALFAGDIGFYTEDLLLEKGYDLRADVLKVGHHGSRFSTGVNFVEAVSPKLSIIGVGRNRYGHPAERVLKVLELAGSEVYTTLEHGTVKVVLD